MGIDAKEENVDGDIEVELCGYPSGYDKRPGVLPAGTIEFASISDAEAVETVAEYLDRSWPALRREPKNHLKYPYLVPGDPNSVRMRGSPSTSWEPRHLTRSPGTTHR